jgi:HD-GYP domain-containing protein (c-di-GMP phosphodiesterase class II)
MADSNDFQLWLLGTYLLLVSFLTSLAFAIWRQIESIKLKQAISRYHRIVAVLGQTVSTETSSETSESNNATGSASSTGSAAVAEIASIAEEKLPQAPQQYESMLSSLIQALIAAVDSRDPNAQNHSEYVAYIAHDLAMDMGLSPEEVKATTLAARLMNVGKIKAPDKALTQANITAADKKKVRLALSASAEILKDVPFDVPVVETLKQAREHVNGSGPLKMTGDSLLPSAKIIALVNAFVAMVSPRSYRDPLTPVEAIEELNLSVDSIYSREVFLALERYISNNTGSEMLTKIQKQFAE